MSSYRVFHWDTFEAPGEDTTLLLETDNLSEAYAFIGRTYGPAGEPNGQRLRADGADYVEIVSDGNVIARYPVG